MGLKVVTEEGRELGRIAEILETGANDVYVVHGEGSEWLLPAIREVVRRVDLAGEIMLVRLLKGMIETEAVLHSHPLPWVLSGTSLGKHPQASPAAGHRADHGPRSAELCP